MFDMNSSPSPATSIAFDAGANRLRLDFALTTPAPADPFPSGQALVTIATFNMGPCDGQDRPMCFSLRSLRFQRPDGSWFEADRPTSVITLNAASFDGPAGCAAVPVRAQTWGAVKAGYR